MVEQEERMVEQEERMAEQEECFFCKKKVSVLDGQLVLTTFADEDDDHIRCNQCSFVVGWIERHERAIQQLDFENKALRERVRVLEQRGLKRPRV